MAGLNPGQIVAIYSEAEILQMLANIKARLATDPQYFDTAWGAEGKTASLGREMTTGEWLGLLLEALHRINPSKYPVTQPDRGGTCFNKLSLQGFGVGNGLPTITTRSTQTGNTNTDPVTASIQTIVFYPALSFGVFTLETVLGTTAPIPYNAAQAAVALALNSLPGASAGQYTVTGNAGSNYAVTDASGSNFGIGVQLGE